VAGAAADRNNAVMKLTRVAAVAAVLTSVAGAPLARAEPVAQSGADHDFATLDRVNGQSQAGLALSKLITDREQLGAINVYHLSLHGQYVSPIGIGGAISIPLTYHTLVDESETGIGNLGLTGFFVQRTAKTDIVYSGGVMLPVGDADDAYLNLFGVAGSRLTDYITGSDVTWLRLAVAPTADSGRWFARADAGVDVPLGGDVDVAALARLNAAVGVEVGEGRAEVTAELNNLIAIGVDSGDSLYQAFAVQWRFIPKRIQPYLALVIPYLESDDGLSFTFTFGVTLRVDPVPAPIP
jgi:hypothetical protein